MKTRRLTPVLGVEAWPKSLDSVETDEAWELLAKYGVLVLRGLKGVRREDFVAFGARLGELEKSPLPVAEFSTLTSFTHDVTHPPSENIWHSDMSFRTSPPLARILRPTLLPDAGGDTLFADMRWVLESLPSAIREVIEGMEAEHDIAKHAPPERREELHARFPPKSHPLIAVHPRSADRYLFCNTAYTTRILDVAPEESEGLLRLLAMRVQLPEAQCRVRWDLETVLLWDNRHLQHYAVADYLPAVRSMERLTVVA